MTRRLLPLLLIVAGCATPVPIRWGTHARSAPVVTINNPNFSDGDPIAGRRTFIEHACIDCHRVAEDPQLPRGARAIAGPQLADLKRLTPREVAERIMSRATGADQALFDRTMKDYTQPLTARNIVDLVAYLRSPKPPSS